MFIDSIENIKKLLDEYLYALETLTIDKNKLVEIYNDIVSKYTCNFTQYMKYNYNFYKEFFGVAFIFCFIFLIEFFILDIIYYFLKYKKICVEIKKYVKFLHIKYDNIFQSGLNLK